MELNCAICLFEDQLVPAVVMFHGTSLCQNHFKKIYSIQAKMHKRMEDIMKKKLEDEQKPYA